jgi:proline iminopeptidase
VLAIARAGAAAGCTEVLFTLGDKPELHYRTAREALGAFAWKGWAGLRAYRGTTAALACLIGRLCAWRYSPAAQKEAMMAEAKLAPNLPDWMVQHANRYLASGGTEGHMYKLNVPGRGEITAPALLLTTIGRKSGDKFIFPLFYGTDGDKYFVVASKGGAPEHPGWYRNILANPDVAVQVATKKLEARARTATGEERLRLWKKALEYWPPYADYQLKTEREIPVVVLDPVR